MFALLTTQIEKAGKLDVPQSGSELLGIIIYTILLVVAVISLSLIHIYIMSGRFKEQYDNFTPEADSFVSQMLARLESIQKLDFMERDRAFYKKQIAAAHTLSLIHILMQT